MSPGEIIFLVLAGILGGALNAVAGGGSFIAFPALLFVGVPPIPANATNTVALWMGVSASTGAYRSHLKLAPRVMVPLFAASALGGLGGAWLLLRTPPHTFLRILPWLMLAATLLFMFGNRLAGDRPSGLAHDASTPALTAAVIFEFFVAIYGGYFGGGVGIMNLAMLAALGMTDIHAMNALKTTLGMAINGIAVLTFVVAGAVAWRQGVWMIAGAILGGYLGAHYAQKLPRGLVRASVVSVGMAMTAYFFIKAR